MGRDIRRDVAAVGAKLDGARLGRLELHQVYKAVRARRRMFDAALRRFPCDWVTQADRHYCAEVEELLSNVLLLPWEYEVEVQVVRKRVRAAEVNSDKGSRVAANLIKSSCKRVSRTRIVCYSGGVHVFSGREFSDTMLFTLS